MTVTPECWIRVVQLNDKPHRVIGILPPEVDFETLWYGAEIVVPARLDRAEAKARSALVHRGGAAQAGGLGKTGTGGVERNRGAT